MNKKHENLSSYYFSDFDWVDHLYKSKSSYHVRDKAWQDGIEKKYSPSAKEGYYLSEYQRIYEIVASGLPF